MARPSSQSKLDPTIGQCVKLSFDDFTRTSVSSKMRVLTSSLNYALGGYRIDE